MIRSTSYHQDLSELLDLVAGGDKQAFEDLYTATAEHLYALVKRLLHNSPGCDEIVCDIYVLLWSTASAYDRADGSGQAWVMALAHQIAVDRLHEQPTRLISGDVTTKRSAQPAGSIEGRPYPYVVVGSAVAAMAGLSALERHVICLAYFDGLDTAEIASTLGLDEITVAVSVRDGLYKMATRCSDAEDPTCPLLEQGRQNHPRHLLTQEPGQPQVQRD